MDTKTRIKELMDARGWTIYELSKRSGLSQTTISNMWKRNTEPTIPSLRAMQWFRNYALAVFRGRRYGGAHPGTKGILYTLGCIIHRTKRNTDESGQLDEINSHIKITEPQAFSACGFLYVLLRNCIA